MKSVKWMFASAILLTSLPVIAQKINIEKGQKLESVSTIKSTTNMEMMGQQISTETTNKTTSLVEVKAASATGYTIDNTTKRMVMSVNAMGQEFNLDSDKPEDLNNEMGGASLKDAVNKTYSVVTDSKGVVNDIAGEKVPETTGGLGDLNQLTKGAQFNLLIPPVKELKVGYAWTDSNKNEQTLIVNNYVVKSVTPTSVIISVTGTYANKGTMEEQGQQINVDMKGNISGENEFEITSGWLLNSSSKMSMTGTMEMMSQKMPISVEVTATTTNKKL